MLTQIGLISDISGAVLVGINIFGPCIFENIDNKMISWIEKYSPPSDDEKLQVEKRVEEASDYLKDYLPLLLSVWEHVSPHIKRYGYLLFVKFVLIIIFYFIMCPSH